jgi:hypothetical protein
MWNPKEQKDDQGEAHRKWHKAADHQENDKRKEEQTSQPTDES